MIEPQIHVWDQISADDQSDLLQRPAISMADAKKCQSIIGQVRQRGDQALIEFTTQFDQVELAQLKVPSEELSNAWRDLDEKQRKALNIAHSNISEFHRAQTKTTTTVQTMPGVQCEMHYRPIETVGLYVPGGTAPLPSTVLMLGVPAQLAKCPKRILCTPPQQHGKISPLVLAAAHLCNIEHVYSVGGAQAIAAMAYGTETIPKVDKIFGPGNPWVTRAKQLVAQDPLGAAYDLPAGPSEVLVIADKNADPSFVASDLLSQAEHGVDSQVVFLSDSVQLANAVVHSLQQQLALLPRQAIANEALRHCRLIVVDSLSDAFSISNRYAPEHLIINTTNARSDFARVRNAGSVFLGPWTPESVGDYCSGTNHVLPTYGYASRYSGLGVDDFQKRISVQELNQAGLTNIGWVVQSLATAEGLDAHARAVSIRLDQSSNPIGVVAEKCS